MYVALYLCVLYEFSQSHGSDYSLPALATANADSSQTRRDGYPEAQESLGNSARPLETDPYECHHDVHVRKQPPDLQYHDGFYALQGSDPGPDQHQHGICQVRHGRNPGKASRRQGDLHRDAIGIVRTGSVEGECNGSTTVRTPGVFDVVWEWHQLTGTLIGLRDRTGWRGSQNDSLWSGLILLSVERHHSRGVKEQTKAYKQSE